MDEAVRQALAKWPDVPSAGGGGGGAGFHAAAAARPPAIAASVPTASPLTGAGGPA